MIDVHFCKGGDIYVFDADALIWSPYSDLSRFGVQEKESVRFVSFGHASEYVRSMAIEPEWLKDTYICQLEAAAKDIKLAPLVSARAAGDEETTWWVT